MFRVYYGPPNSKWAIEEQICRQILARCKSNRAVVVGDFNFPCNDWDSLSAWDADGREFMRSIQKDILIQYLNSPTRRGALLDLILGNEPGQVVEFSVEEQLWNSDRNAVSFNILMDKD
eukprot:g37304.t1